MTTPGPRDYVAIHKGLHLLEVTDIERRILGFLVALKLYVWTNQEASLLHIGIALELDASAVTVKRGLLALSRRGWVKRGIDGRGHHWIQLTDKVTDACRVAARHQEVRRWVGSVQWTEHVKHQGDMDQFCGMLRAEALNIDKRTREAVQAVSGAIFRTYPNNRRVRQPKPLVSHRGGLNKRTKSVRK